MNRSAGDAAERHTPTLSSHLLHGAARPRCGLVRPAQPIQASACDATGPLFDGRRVHNAATPADPANPWQGVSGAVALDADAAADGAVAEALERLAAAQAGLEVRARGALTPAQRLDESAFALFSASQRAAPGFPWPMPEHDEDLFAAVHALDDNRVTWVPQELVGLGPRSGQARLPSTSTGLAAWRDGRDGAWLALLRAAQELLERDALAVTWLNGVAGRRIALPAPWQAHVAERGGQLQAFDLTQQWNPHPVIAVAGGIPFEGRPRHVLGIACRADPGEALHKALLEWQQALTFAAHLCGRQGDRLPREPAALRSFDEHAAFYTLRPELWPQLPLLRDAGDSTLQLPPPAAVAGPAAQRAIAELDLLRRRLGSAGIALYYRELTTADVAAAGLRVMRVLSPQLSGLHADERAPFLGGRCRDVAWRYPGVPHSRDFPNPFPHPLG
ncbi:YcaO-like family protein [Stenotrophomonas rhizophila]|uniref:YcaO-like family protein n=1 Tax=Stenotrophomonas rhizophila TaxID=216778 RepID=UPI001E389AC7|nr:YcaO-like family protein [Stenotrophomonas rhizophila]MCC7635836.1 YcaO-like family protein [Stenotrophomonas rhizophila]MCC7662660.1 YcaO-like family protein [Stenotrophomonas rhizophila]